MRKVVYEGSYFIAIKKGENYFGIELNGVEYTSTNTISSEIKKTKLLDKVYRKGYSDGVDY